MKPSHVAMLVFGVCLAVGCGDSTADNESGTLKECSAEDCGPAPGAPGVLCWDGTTAGPTCGANSENVCGWTVTTCPDNPCDTTECAPGTFCDLVEVQCVTTPCPPQPQCVPGQPEGCPDTDPDPFDACGGEITCSYGTEVCCGQSNFSYVCSCVEGEFNCFATDACLGAPFGCSPDDPCLPEECGPPLGVPSFMCEDGSIAGPVCERDEDRECRWRVTMCPEN